MKVRTDKARQFEGAIAEYPESPNLDIVIDRRDSGIEVL